MTHTLFNFFPRPEAKAMRWEQLLQPVQSAVRNLLVILAGAERQPKDTGQDVAKRQSKDSGLEVASCFLVHGERGTGKTSVLLNAKKAVETFCEQDNYGVFFQKPVEQDGNKSALSLKRQMEEKDAYKCAKELKGRVVWLDILDLEPVQPDTNLLTTVLTRIRGALKDGNQDHELTSIFESGGDSARPLLDQLIADATVMWESIKEADTRSTANRQVSAAEIYAGFKVSFNNAMDKLSTELGRPYGQNERRSIILPIDNIDRSTDHLKNIVKLAELVSHPRLWLVMAGGREDVTTFLERAFWKELILIGGEAGGLGKTEPRGEDETLSMARRQAAATALKIWPPGHRVNVGLVAPEETLAFCPPETPKGIESCQTIIDLFRKVGIPSFLQGDTHKNDGNELTLKEHPINFLELFIYCKTAAPYFTIDDIKKPINKQLKDNLNELIKRVDKEESSICKNLMDKRDKLRDKLDKLNFGENNNGATISKLVGILNEIIDIDIIDHRKDKLRSYLAKWCDDDTGNNSKSQNLRLLNRAIIEESCPNCFVINPYWLTWAGRNALRLPARSVIDLWHLVHWVANDTTFFMDNDNKAEQIARTMLRNVIAESQVTNHLSRHLQTDVIYTGGGGTLLNFREHKLKVECIASIDTGSFFPIKPKDDIKSSLCIRRARDSFPSFKLKDEKEGIEEELPKLVAAWLIILYDVLAFAPKLSVLTQAQIQSPITETRHALLLNVDGQGKRIVEKALPWPLPQWEIFHTNDLFWRYLRHFQSRQENQQLLYPDEKEVLPRVLAAGWIRCIFDAFDALNGQVKQESSTNSQSSKDTQSPSSDAGQEKPKDEDNETWFPIFSQIKEDGKPSPGWEEASDINAYIANYEKKLLTTARQLYTNLLVDAAKPQPNRCYYDSQAMIDWLLNDLPLFFSSVYVPINNAQGSPCRFDIDNGHLGQEQEAQETDLSPDLIKAWIENKEFIMAALHGKLADLFIPENGASEIDKVKLRKTYQAFQERLILSLIAKDCNSKKDETENDPFQDQKGKKNQS